MVSAAISTPHTHTPTFTQNTTEKSRCQTSKHTEHAYTTITPRSRLRFPCQRKSACAGIWSNVQNATNAHLPGGAMGRGQEFPQINHAEFFCGHFANSKGTN